MTGHRIGKVLTVLSFLAFVLILCLWVRSYWASDVIGRVWLSSDKLHGGSVAIESNSGAVSIERWWRDLSLTERARKAATRNVPEVGFYYLRGNSDKPSFYGLWFRAYFREPMSQFDTATRVDIGHWVFGAIFSVSPALWFRRFMRRRRRLRAGLCPMCGYDLRLTPTRCPECNYLAQG